MIQVFPPIVYCVPYYAFPEPDREINPGVREAHDDERHLSNNLEKDYDNYIFLQAIF